VKSKPLELHPKAQENFNQKAEALLSLLVAGPAADVEAPPPGAAGVQELFTTRLPDHAVRSDVTVLRDLEGTILARCFVHRDQIIGLKDEGYLALRRLAEGMQRVPALRSLIGVDVLEELIFSWLHARVTGSAGCPMSTEVLAHVAERLNEYDIILPLFRVRLPEAIQIGPALLRTISGSDFDRWETVADRSDAPEHRARLQSALLEERKRMQGFAAATLTLRGEREHVLRVARNAAEEAVSLLRLFSPAMLSPRARSFCTLWGREMMQSTVALVFSPERRSLSFGEALETEQDFVWWITPERLRLIRVQALDSLVQALYESPKTDFRDEVRSALVLYSESAIRSAPAEKLLAVLIPLESLLLRSSSEPIAENISTRLAFAIGETLPERKRIAEITRAAYGMRSAYVHHRRQVEGVDDMETLRVFLQYAWRFFLGLGLQVGQYRERDEYLSALDDRKFA
jgi:hypothetical protein